jgi:hypothetical protein
VCSSADAPVAEFARCTSLWLRYTLTALVGSGPFRLPNGGAYSAGRSALTVDLAAWIDVSAETQIAVELRESARRSPGPRCCAARKELLPATSISCAPMNVISFKGTTLYKRGFWLSAVALVAAVAAPSVVDRSIFANPLVHIVPLCVLIGFWIYFLQKGRFFSIADEVVDAGDSLRVKRAGTEIVVPFSAITSAETKTEYRMLRITIHLRERTKFGSRIDFWPQASLWGNPFAVQQVAIELAERAKRAGGGNV